MCNENTQAASVAFETGEENNRKDLSGTSSCLKEMQSDALAEVD